MQEQLLAWRLMQHPPHPLRQAQLLNRLLPPLHLPSPVRRRLPSHWRASRRARRPWLTCLEVCLLLLQLQGARPGLAQAQGAPYAGARLLVHCRCCPLRMEPRPSARSAAAAAASTVLTHCQFSLQQAAEGRRCWRRQCSRCSGSHSSGPPFTSFMPAEARRPLRHLRLLLPSRAPRPAAVRAVAAVAVVVA